MIPTTTTGAAMLEEVDSLLRRHLSRPDTQEDLCFALYHPSTGERRFTSLLHKPVLPLDGDRQIHGNASFNAQYFERALSMAVSDGVGLAILHSHPGASTWQGLSNDDLAAEAGMAGAVKAGTSLPLVGLTLSTRTGFWSARHWHRLSPHSWTPCDCEGVRVVGKQLVVSHSPNSKQSETPPEALTRTAHSWGLGLQQTLSRLRVGIVGLGSVGSVVAEALARMGFGSLVLIDPDRVEEINLDRTLNAYRETASVSEYKAVLAARSAIRAATLPGFRARALSCGIQSLTAFRQALDCDVLFSCVDRPWPRSILNRIAYAHLIPVIDGGIHVSQTSSGNLRSADWATFVVGPTRRCLECAGQFRSEFVAVEQAGDLDDPTYIENLSPDSPLRKRENVFAFSLALASQEILRLIQLVGRPAGLTVPHEERYTFPASNTELTDKDCHPNCAFKAVSSQGDSAGDPGLTT